MRQRVRNWLQTEYRRGVAILPRLILSSVIMTIVIGILLSCFMSVMESRQEEKESKLRIGYVAEEDMLTRLLVSYVSEMDSVDEWCRFVSVTEEKGKKELQEGKLAALLILPENVVDEILSGSNAPATLLLPEKSSTLGIVFEELADAGIRMLSVAQGEIYTIYELAYECGFTQEQLLSMCDDINAYNLGLLTERESWFRTEKVSITGNEEVAVYYGSALVACCLLLCVLFFGNYVKHEEQEQLLIWKRLGISPVVQVIGRITITSLLLMIFLLPMTGLWLLPWLRRMLVPVLTWQSIVLIVFSLICIAAYDLLLYQMVEEHRAAVVTVGLFVVVQGYVSGYFVPTVLLPEIIQKLAVFIPTTYIRWAFSAFFSGDIENAGSVSIGLMVLICCFTVANIIVMYVKTSTYADGHASSFLVPKRKQALIKGSLFGIYAKRLFYRKSFWCSLLVIGLVSVGLTSMEQQSETTITAVFYDESGDWEELLCEYEGYIQFVACESEAEVRNKVLHDEAECGYWIPKDFRERIESGEARKSIVFYKDSDALMAETVNEILFEQLFMELSKEWFTDYIRETDQLLTVLEHKMTDGSTFSIEKEYWSTDSREGVTQKEERTTYPVVMVVIMAIVLCGLSGAWEAFEDYRRYHFFKRKPGVIIVCNIFQPIVCGVMMGILIFLLNSY